MPDHTSHLLRLCLPLLTHPQPEVRRQMGILLHCGYGEAITARLRGLLKSPEPELREQVRIALDVLAEFTTTAARSGPAAGFSVRCLGSLRVRINGSTLQGSDWDQADTARAGGQKVRAAFAYLVHRGWRGATREALGEAVWGGGASPAGVARALKSLRCLLESIGGPELVEQALSIGDERCLLNPEAYHCDAHIFERTYELAWQTEHHTDLATAVPLYAQALDLYSGPYMVDILPGSGWMREQRELLADNIIIASERLAEHAYTTRGYQECVRRCQQALDDAPAADEVTVWLLRAYAALGQHAEIEHAYRRYLRAAKLTPDSREGESDPVVRVYQDLKQARTVGG